MIWGMKLPFRPTQHKTTPLWDAMAHTTNRLTALTARTIKEVGYHADGRGLYLNVRDSGSRSWILRYMLNGKAREMGLGAFPEVGLMQARQKRDALRESLKKKVDPIDAREVEAHAAAQARAKAVASATTFNECVERFLSVKSVEWSNTKHAAQWRSTLTAYASPVFGAVAIADVDTDMVLKALTPIWLTKTVTAPRVRGRIESVLDWAKASKLRGGENPALWRGNLDKLLPQPSKVATTEHYAALPYRDMHAFVQLLSHSDATAARAMEFVIYTLTRTGEAIGAKWSEIDFDSRVWTIPAHRMKGTKGKKRSHRVPLSDAALKLLQRLHATTTSAYVFPSPRNTEARDRPLSNMAMLEMLKRMQRTDITTHGFRSSFRDWCAEQTNYPRELAEATLSHAVKDKTEAAYLRGDYLEKRARLMQAWADYCHTAPQVSTKVTPIRKTR
jgi:integrase